MAERRMVNLKTLSNRGVVLSEFLWILFAFGL